MIPAIGYLDRAIESGVPYNREMCVACEERNGPQTWSGNGSLPLHHRCFDMVNATQNSLIWIIQQLIPGDENFEKRRVAHLQAVRSVRMVCCSPLRTYAERYGQIALQSLFNSVGVEAVAIYCAESRLSKLQVSKL